ncbi:hypothetical protein LTR91_009160 [Friedmanniomyces endolithicus]|uniref:Oxidoreductase n=1 Tax=Friedmanniomyces endolithicus TaxID=329885 RepID=A0AAN6QUL4_9PEZI|nr:hypothetical protein LTR94_012922 [Friedmanniomyces endolithicus]KAK0803330.1 hypothetical protein LTR38_006190 [Friedmanniomyces endolithicus]KAK0832583.1 hypothetical protein LTR03_015097 [Friedmanniomyces endolithicus]KAK0843856.1 hypothetical protein LTS02_015929 [Friedmanniomyces endolithicus]KAK0876885.1 hypothetical protein LTR87_009234 [Friedmanniomyces endolithicus]
MLQWAFGRSFDPSEDIPTLVGKIVLVTGGNAGLGKETILQLARHEPKEIYLAARTRSKAESAIAEIVMAVPKANLTFLELDLSSFTSVKQAAKDFQARSNRLDILINNAGVAALPYSTTKDGFEIQFGTNHMGHALLTHLLLPTLLKTAELPDADVRVINVSSKGHMFAPPTGIFFEQAALEKLEPLGRYGHSKLANILHARELQRRYPSVTAIAVHPGVIITDIYDTYSETSLAMRYLAPVVKAVASYGILPDVYDVPGGAFTQLWAATAPRETVRSGYYWTPVGVKSAGTNFAQDEGLAAQLWEWTLKEIASRDL